MCEVRERARGESSFEDMIARRYPIAIQKSA